MRVEMDKCTIKFIIPSHKSMHSYLTDNDLKVPPRFDLSLIHISEPTRPY